MSILLLHHRDDVYPDPFAFRPERFLGRKPGTYTWIPFGGGIRRCLGAALAMAEQRVVLEADRAPHRHDRARSPARARPAPQRDDDPGQGLPRGHHAQDHLSGLGSGRPPPGAGRSREARRQALRHSAAREWPPRGARDGTRQGGDSLHAHNKRSPRARARARKIGFTPAVRESRGRMSGAAGSVRIPSPPRKRGGRESCSDIALAVARVTRPPPRPLGRTAHRPGTVAGCHLPNEAGARAHRIGSQAARAIPLYVRACVGCRSPFAFWRWAGRIPSAPGSRRAGSVSSVLASACSVAGAGSWAPAWISGRIMSSGSGKTIVEAWFALISESACR